MGKEKKTNAMRILDKHKVSYEIIQYECDEFTDGVTSAQKSGCPLEQSYKTLIFVGKSKDYYVFVLPVKHEVDLKRAARIVQEKSLTTLPLKELTNVTGYVRGGCSPLGMKKEFSTVLYEGARSYDVIYVSGGRIGVTIAVSPEALAEVTGAKFGDFLEDE